MLFPVSNLFDPQQHITARQLRNLGFGLRENIPDEAFVARDAISLRGDELIDDGSISIALIVLHPFSVPELELVESVG